MSEKEILQAKTDAALKETHNALKYLCEEFVKAGAKPWEIEIAQQATPEGIVMFVRKVNRNQQGELKDV